MGTVSGFSNMGASENQVIASTSSISSTSSNAERDYDYWMREIERIFAKEGGFTEEDYKELQNAMKNLNGLQGLPQWMIDKKKALFAVLKNVGITVDGYTGGKSIPPWEAMNIVKNSEVKDGNKTINFLMIVQNTRNKESIDISSAQLINFATSLNANYSKELTALGDAIELLDSIMNSLRELLDLLNLTEMPPPREFNNDPNQEYANIPAAIKYKLTALGVDNQEDWEEWIKNDDNKAKFADIGREYMSEPIVPVPIPAELEKAGEALLRLRESLLQQIDALKKSGVTDSQLLKDLEDLVNRINVIMVDYDGKQVEVDNLLKDLDAITKEYDDFTKEYDDFTKEYEDLKKRFDEGTIDEPGKARFYELHEQKPGMDAKKAELTQQKTNLESQLAFENDFLLRLMRDGAGKFIADETKPKAASKVASALGAAQNLSSKKNAELSILQSNFQEIQKMLISLEESINKVMSRVNSGIR